MLLQAFLKPKKSDWDLIFNAWIPFKVDTWYEYVAGITYQVIGFALLLGTTIVWIVSFMALSEHLIAHLKILKSAIRNVIAFCENDHNKVLEGINCCVEHQVILYDYFNELQNYMKFPLLWMSFGAAIALGSAGFLAMEMSGGNEILGFLIMFVPECLSLLIICWYGQEMSDQIYTENYWHELVKTLECSHWSLLYISASLYAVIMLFTLGKMKALDVKMRNGIYKYPWGTWPEELQYRSKAKRNLRFYSRTFTILVTIGGVQMILQQAFLKTKKSDWDLIFNAWLPFKVDTWSEYVAGITYQVIGFALLLSTTMAWIDSFIALSEYLIAHLKILKSAIHNVIVFCENSDDKVLEGINRCVEHHVIVYDFFNELQNYMKIPLVWISFGAATALGTAGFLAMEFTSANQILGFVMIFIPECLLILILCWYGQEILDESESIVDAVYETEWYTLSPQARRSLVMIMMRSGKPMILNGSVMVYSLKSYLEILTTTYSFLNMLHAVRQK